MNLRIASNSRNSANKYNSKRSKKNETHVRCSILKRYGLSGEIRSCVVLKDGIGEGEREVICVSFRDSSKGKPAAG